MELLLGPRMAKGKRPAKGDGEKGSHQVRVMPDMGEMISWIIRIEGGTTAVLLDPMIRPQVTARYRRYEAEIEKIKVAEEALKRVEEQVKAKTRDGGRTEERPPAERRRRAE